MTRYVKATFSDGSVARRSSEGKIYTHACGSGRYASFATSLERAVKSANGREIVAVEEITAKEYRALGDDERTARLNRQARALLEGNGSC